MADGAPVGVGAPVVVGAPVGLGAPVVAEGEPAVVADEGSASVVDPGVVGRATESMRVSLAVPPISGAFSGVSPPGWSRTVPMSSSALRIFVRCSSR